MGGRQKKSNAAASSSLLAHNFLPTLTRPTMVIGSFVSMQGKDWDGCPAADKEKIFKCTVRAFEAIHDFGAFRSGGFEVQEMGESGV